MNRTEKEAFVAEFRQSLDRARVVVVTDFIGLNVAAVTDLRERLRKKNARMTVVKNNLVRLAGKDTPFAQLDELFVGPNAVVLGFGEDPVETAKVLTEFAKERPQLKIKAGLLDGRTLRAADIETLASLPPKDVLRAQLLGVLRAPSTRLVSVLAAVPRSLLYVLSAKAGQPQAA